MKNAVKNNAENTIAAPVAGRAVPLSEVADEIFASGIVGEGAAIEPESGLVYAPADGTVTHFVTKHAIGIFSDMGAEVLVHIGIDTVNLDGVNYKFLSHEGARVKKGDLLASFELDNIRAAGYRTVTPVVICNSGGFSRITPVSDAHLAAGDAFIEIVR